MNTSLFNIPDFIKISIMAFVAIILINVVLRKMGLSQFQA